MSHRARVAPAALLVAALISLASTPVIAEDAGSKLKAAKALRKQGNYKEALKAFRDLNKDAEVPSKTAVDAVNGAVQSAQNLGQLKLLDAILEEAVKAHPKDWQVLKRVAWHYRSTTHYGYIVSGEFQRGWMRRGGATYADCWDHDRVRSLQLLEQATALAEAAKADADSRALLALEFASALQTGRGGSAMFRLQALTDLSELPEPQAQRYYGGGPDGAPVNDDGEPVVFATPKSWQAAKNDGERWRWQLEQAKALSRAVGLQARFTIADFSRAHFSVRTLRRYGSEFMALQDKASTDDNPYALASLGDDETIARLATGIKRFKLPADYNYIAIYKELAEVEVGKLGGEEAKDLKGLKALQERLKQLRRLIGGRDIKGDAMTALAQLYEDRRQYPKAAEWWEKDKETARVKQIRDNWCRIEPTEPKVAGEGASFELRFRNGRKVDFEARIVDQDRLLEKVKSYLKSRPRRMDWRKTRINNIGWRIFHDNQTELLGDKVASWSLDVEPFKDHVDRVVTVSTPLQKAGCYLITARMADGNESRVLMWINDTVIVDKRLDKAMGYFVADARTGAPLKGVNLEFFGYRTQWKNVKNGRNYQAFTFDNFAEETDEQGMAVRSTTDETRRFNWLIIGRGENGRKAWYGFTRVWSSSMPTSKLDRTVGFGITDRPVYRPKQDVNWKFWVRRTRYDAPDKCVYEGKPVKVRIYNPKREKVFEKVLTFDDMGGIDGKLTLPEEATLGVWRIQALGHGQTSFRVEEYKKPEFEVKVEAPSEPVQLGETVTARVEAKYYFGAPVTKAKVKIKVLRTPHTVSWYPSDPWDWFYGPGYWWFQPDYTWMPGWGRWGCCRPSPWWFRRSSPQPEVVLENEVPIGKDGTVEVKIDTTLAKLLHGNQDHRYSITAEVVDESRRTIVGSGQVMVARSPFKVFAWLNRGYIRSGEAFKAEFNARTVSGKPVKGQAEVTLFQLSYDKNGAVTEAAVQTWKPELGEDGRLSVPVNAAEPGQYRIACEVTDEKGRSETGATVFLVVGPDFNGASFKFNDLEVVAEKKTYAPGDTLELLVNTRRTGSTVLLFVKPQSGIYPKPRVLRLKGKSTKVAVPVAQADMPNFYVEALTISDGKVHTVAKEIVVPPAKRILDVEVLPSKTSYLPGEMGRIKVRLKGPDGEPFVGDLALTMYDRSVEYIAGGSNVRDIREAFWKWRRRHYPRTGSSLQGRGGAIYLKNQVRMQNLGAFGHIAGRADTNETASSFGAEQKGGAPAADAMADGAAAELSAAPSAPGRRARGFAGRAKKKAEAGGGGGGGGAPKTVAPKVRKNFADTALWTATTRTDDKGEATLEVKMPENLTGWKIRTWAMGAGARCGEAESVVVTKKNLLLRMQAPRFFVETDEVVLSANIHNDLATKKSVKAVLELEGAKASFVGGEATQVVEIPSHGEQRVDWRIKVEAEGELIVRMKALTDEESDAMQKTFPVFVHGMSKTVSVSGVVRPDAASSTFKITVPKERRLNESELEVRFSPTLAGAMVDALPYLTSYPYGCTEQTLNRFVPTVITRRVLQDMKLDLAAIQKKRTNLNAQQMGEAGVRAKQWKQFKHNPVFDDAEVLKMVKAGVKKLTAMQCSDGGWGWFSGYGERSYPHTTATVVHGLQVAKDNGAALVPGVLERGIAWLKQYQRRQRRLLDNAATETKPWKSTASNLDAMVYMVLADQDVLDRGMRDYLYRDRNKLSVYAQAMFGLALHKQKQQDKLAMVMRNISQFVKQDDENQTAWLELPNNGYWWYWYGSEYEAHAYYLKLLSRVEPKGETASRLVKYLLNNRRNGTWWKSTRDTALCIEAMADYMRASGEDKPDMTVEVLVDGKVLKTVTINAENLFSFDNVLRLSGDAVETGEHTVELRRKGKGPVYFNAYLTYFSLEDFITRAGLEIKVERKVFKLKRVEATKQVAGSKGQVVEQSVEKYERIELESEAELKSGDLVEIELTVESKNDYEYVIFEDFKGAGFEPVTLRSGYSREGGLPCYREFRDERVAFFVRSLPRGKRTISYRVRAEIPGRFSALPTRARAMYAPELRGNSDEIKLKIKD